MTNEFIVIGEHKENELELLVKGADGAFYDYDPVREAFSPVDPDENWVITETGVLETGDAMPMTEPAAADAD
jgi:hypothetical protein